MKFLVVLFGVLALLALSHAQNDESEGSTDNPSEDPSPLPPLPPSRHPRPPGLGPRPKPPHGNRFGPNPPNEDRRHFHGPIGRPQEPPQNPEDDIQPVVFDSSVGSNSHFGTSNHFGDQKPDYPEADGR